MSGIFTSINPAGLGTPRGFSHGLLAPPGAQVLFVAGQTAADADGRIADRGFVAQFRVALDKVIAVVRGAGGSPEHVGRMTIYVTDMETYRAHRPALRDAWTSRMGTHYPAMALVQVVALFDTDASVEIDAIAVIRGATTE